MLYNDEIIHEIKYGSFLLSVNTENYDENIVIDCDEYFSEFSGYSKEEFQNRIIKFKEMLIPEEYYHICNFVKSNMNELGEIYLEHKMICKNGTVTIITTCNKILSQDNGKIILKSTITQASIPSEDNSYNLLNLNAILENMPCGVAVYKILENHNLQLAYANDKFYSQLGFTKETYMEATDGGFVKNLISVKERDRIFDLIYNNISHNNHIDIQTTMSKADGSTAIMNISGRIFSSSDGIPRLQVVYFDVTKFAEYEETIRYQNERYKIIEESTDELLFDYNISNDVLNLPKKEKFKSHDYKFEQYIKGGKCRFNVHPEDYLRYISVLEGAMHKPTKNYVDIRTRAFDDDYTWYRIHYVSVANNNGEISHIYGRYVNIDNEKQLHLNTANAKSQIEQLTISDNITGLLNRHAFKVHAQEIINEFDVSKEYLAVVYSDINNFSFINDNYGYDAGDSMLNDFTAILNTLESVKKACRINSDFFSFILAGKSKEEIFKNVKSIHSHFKKMQKAKYINGDFSLSSGIYYITKIGENISIAIDNADLARKHIKANKEVNVCIYNDDFRSKRTREKSIVTKLQNAISERQIELFLQPKFSMNSRQVIGAEALARWRNPDGSYKLPYEFIDVLENAGYIVELDFFIYEEALRTVKKWQESGKNAIPISVNFSRKNNINPEFTKKILQLADKYKIDNKFIEFEITESAFAENTITMLKNMDTLRSHGFKVDIDDFGVGYSSLSFLLDSPIDIVKVDKVFVDGIEKSKYHQDFIRQMCMLINTTHKEIVFEGVETEFQANFLCQCGFDLAQGWLFDKAISLDEFEKKYV